MSHRFVGWGGAYTTLVGTFSSLPDPSQDEPGVRLATSWRTQHIISSKPNGGTGLRGGIIPDAASKPTYQGTVTVADNDFSTGQAILTILDWVFVANLDFLVGGTVNATATALAAAIDAVPILSATALAAVVTVEAPYGLDPITFTVLHLGTKTNYTLSPVQGVLAPTGRLLDPPQF